MSYLTQGLFVGASLSDKYRASRHARLSTRCHRTNAHVRRHISVHVHWHVCILFVLLGNICELFNSVIIPLINTINDQLSAQSAY